MIVVYNVLLTLLLLFFLPFLLIKAATNKRYRYHFLDRFFPKPISKSNYFLIHASSFGEIKTVLSLLNEFEKGLKSEAVISVFTDTAHKFSDKKDTFLMPIDLIFIHKRALPNPPKIALFFETEIWPSYIYTLKKNNVRIILFNARMSENSFKSYKKFGFLFKKTIGSFDLIIAKSKTDAKRYRYFNDRVIVCGNIKSCAFSKKNKEISSKEDFLIKTNKPILTLASFHKEELNTVLEIISNLKNDFFIILAPRHLEDLKLFESYLSKNKTFYTRRSEKKVANSLLILDTMGELEKIYSFSNVSIIGGSFHENLKGHNPIEPVFYNNLTICGPYMESFKEEVTLLKKHNLVYQISNKDELNKINELVKTSNTTKPDNLFKTLSYILNCHIFNTINTLKTS